jgi:hypothetical protein
MTCNCTGSSCKWRKSHTDGFGTLGGNGFRKFSESGSCSTYYLHGALHLFEDDDGGTKKLAYLRYCYNNLKETAGDIFIFGHSVSNNDRHIYDAIFSSFELKRVFFCVHNPTKDWSILRERLEHRTHLNPYPAALK